jgi:hypothetical protein
MNFRPFPLPLALLVLLASCAGPGAHAPTNARADLPALFAAAFRTDATGDPRDAASAYVDVVRAAAAADFDPWQIAALQASLDALAMRAMPALGDASADAGLVWRTADGTSITQGLVRAQGEARGPFARGLVGRALATAAQRRGDAAEADKRRTESGCAREAVVVGPTTWFPVTGVEEAGPLERADARVEASYKVADAFGTVLHPVTVRGRGCAIDLSAETARPGVREVVVDVNVDRAQAIGLVLRAHGAATLRAGGTLVVRRPFELGDGEAARFARVSVTPGTLRIVARVGTAKEDDWVEIDVWGEDGKPLATKAPEVGSAATSRVLGVTPVDSPPCKGDAEVLLASAAATASGDAREAERMLWGTATRGDAAPELALVYGRAVESARDLSPATRTERARSAYERVLEVWPSSWEAVVAHAVLAGSRRGREEAGIETLRDLDALRAKMGDAKPPVLDAFDALTSGREHLFDRARAALDRGHARLAGTAISTDAENAASPRLGAELAAAACDPARVGGQETLSCFDALRSLGAWDRASAELTRLRGVLGAPQRFLSLELREALAAGDEATAARALSAMLPAERTLTALAALDSSAEVRTHLLHAAVDARDSPISLAPLLRALGDDPTGDLDGVADRVAAQDRATPILPNAATAVLAHKERYNLEASGLLHWRLFDVRRVSGTTDVDQNAQAAAPEVWGRSVSRALRRRILKRDGRVLEPERTPRASQAHADLSQLEQGDIVEAVYEGWSLPGDTGDIGIDTPDVLPERTAVHEATIELRVPQALRGALWSHREIGKPVATAEGDARVLTWHVVDHPVRRVEDGVPKMDRSAGVSFSTAQWSDVARALRETIASLDEHDPEIAAWARDAGRVAATAPMGGAGDPNPAAARATVDAIVAAAGKALRESNSATLSDFGGGIAPVQSETARTFLASHEGSRTWLIARALRELGIPRDLVVVENEPYSADPAFPPHFGRFLHPLVVAHVGGADVWIDSDVAGPPLPAGRISPELRGRIALRTDGAIAPLPSIGGGQERDEIDVRLALDERGNARGTFVVVLRGRDAQELAEALFRIVGAERQRALRDVVLAWLPWANVDDVQLASSEGSWQVSLRAEVSVSGYAQQDGTKTWLLPGIDALHWSWPRARVSSLGATFATRAGRESALAVSNAVQYHVHRRIELPKGASVERIPGPLEIKTTLVEASRRIAFENAGSTGQGSRLEDDFILGVATGTVPTAEYEAFVRAAHAIDDGFLASTRAHLP